MSGAPTRWPSPSTRCRPCGQARDGPRSRPSRPCARRVAGRPVPSRRVARSLRFRLCRPGGESMTDRIGVAVIGAGVAGRAHAHGYRSAGTVLGPGLPEVRLVSVADADEDLARDAAARYGFERADSGWQAVAGNGDVDVVSVVVANVLHRDIVTALAAEGKHVLCEKPLAATIPDARAMIDAVERAGVIARVGFTFRRAPAISALRDQIASGRLGRPVHFSGHYWTDYGCDPRAPISWRYRGGPGSGALADLGSHLTDVGEFLFGPVESVRGATLATVVAERPVPLG